MIAFGFRGGRFDSVDSVIGYRCDGDPIEWLLVELLISDEPEVQVELSHVTYESSDVLLFELLGLPPIGRLITASTWRLTLVQILCRHIGLLRWSWKNLGSS